jgi:hypothetical protein
VRLTKTFHEVLCEVQFRTPKPFVIVRSPGIYKLPDVYLEFRVQLV